MSNGWKKTVKKLTTWKDTIVDEAAKKSEKEKEIEARQIDRKELRNVLRAALLDAKDGVDGEKGEKGDRGERGPKGERGQDGKDGRDGRDGEKGEKGDKGDKGDTGAQGLAGRDGKDGRNGIDGKDGKNGSEWFIFDTMVEAEAGVEGDLALVVSTSNYYRKEFKAGNLIWRWKGNLKGKDGERGERGYNGSQGAKGEKGDAGTGGGGGGSSYLAAATDVNLQMTTETFVRAFGASALVITLPDAATFAEEVCIKNTTTQILTIAPHANQATVNGVATVELPALDVGGFGYGNLGSAVRLSPQGGQFWVTG